MESAAECDGSWGGQPPQGSSQRRRSAQRRRLRRALPAAALALFLAACLGACARIQGWAPQEAPSAGPMLREDAGPRVYDEDQVDVPARPISRIRPVYPPRMRALGIPGEVDAQVIVLADGTTGGGRILETTSDAFTASARKAIRAARFFPALRAGHPVASWVTLRLHFELQP